MSTSAPRGPVRYRWPTPATWPVWVVPVLLAFVQVFGSMGAQHGGGPRGSGPPWADDRGAGAGPGSGAGHADLDPLGFGLLLAGPALLLLRRRNPVFTLAAVGAVTALYLLRAYPYGPAPFSLGVAMMAAVVAGHRLAAWAGTGLGLAAFFGLSVLIGVPADERGSGWFSPEEPTLVAATFVTAWALVVLVTSELVRTRAQRAAETARTRAEEERRQASEERLRMARELHDVLAHNISMINVQAGVALHLMDENPEQARTALAAIKEASKEALTEMRGVIGALRAQGETAPRTPTAGLGGLDDLLARARSAGLRVDAEITGDRRPLHAGTDLAAFRIVQESLTNVSRHAGPGPVTARVRIAYGETEIVVQVDDDGQGVSLLDDPGGSGSGISGMRERAAALGGSFEAGPRPGGGYRVRATLPLEAGPEPDRPEPDGRAPAEPDGASAVRED
ncbi:sensor histidine kinase [Actinomadura sp. KC216]|uniref:sensor histidine kinase n=1 Tax=Actinomadura sp. KC216 TaxID=2530370 RepID=UPI00104CDA6F|nr:sensor histidine kinase [Actinomadura sp. KC216]TDB73152.1 sensor histidine kinase [Actinomadura sp. KC216]